MSKLTVKSGKGKITLTKSSKLVGLKTKKEEELEEKDYVNREFHKNLGGFKVVELEKGKDDIDDKLDEVRAKDEIDIGTHVYYAEGSDIPMIPTGEIIILFQEGTSEGEQKIVLEEYHLELVQRRSEVNVIAKVTSKSPNPIKVASFLMNISLVKYAEPDLDAQVEEYNFAPPVDELVSHQWHLQNNGRVVDAHWNLKKGADAKVIDAWRRMGNTGSSDIIVAVIDNGFDLDHPDLKAKVFKPFDLWTQSSRVTQGDPSFTHGTPCASVAVASSNGNGIVGAAPNARFMPVNGTSFSLRATEQMFDYCIKNGADVISCSWGTTDPAFNLNPLKEEAIAKAAREGRGGKGSVICYAVGNDGYDFVNFYAAHPDVIAVGACTSQDEHATYSNKGREVSVVAPSNGDWPITAARASWDQGVSWESGAFRYWRDGKSRGTQYKHFGGTSSSCPLVAGICALILSANPDLTAKQVKSILERTADKIGRPSDYDSRGHSKKYGYGRVNAAKAVAEAIRLKDASDPPKVVEESIATGQGLFRFSVQRQPSKGFGVQVGAFAEYGNVLVQAEKLERTFNQPVIVNINQLEGQTVYKIVVGAFDSRTDASRLQTTMEDQGVKGFVRNLEDLK